MRQILTALTWEQSDYTQVPNSHSSSIASVFGSFNYLQILIVSIWIVAKCPVCPVGKAFVKIQVNNNDQCVNLSSFYLKPN